MPRMEQPTARPSDMAAMRERFVFITKITLGEE
jgi:hypothetical protein